MCATCIDLVLSCLVLSCLVCHVAGLGDLGHRRGRERKEHRERPAGQPNECGGQAGGPPGQAVLHRRATRQGAHAMPVLALLWRGLWRALWYLLRPIYIIDKAENGATTQFESQRRDIRCIGRSRYWRGRWVSLGARHAVHPQYLPSRGQRQRCTLWRHDHERDKRQARYVFSPLHFLV